MKNSRLHSIFLWVALFLLGVSSVHFNARGDANLGAAAQVGRDKDEEVRPQNRVQPKAQQESPPAQEAPKQARLAGDAEEAKRRDERDAAMRARNKARQKAITARHRVEVLAKEIAAIEKETKKIEEDTVALRREETVRQDFVKKLEAYQQSLTAGLTKIDAASAAAARAATLVATKKPQPPLLTPSHPLPSP